MDQRVDYTQRILRGAALKKYKAVLLECKKSEKDVLGYMWTLGNLKALSTENFWTWDKSDGLAYEGGDYLGIDKYANFEKDIWLELVKCMWRKHHRVFQNHLKYIRYDIVKPLCVVILSYAERVQDIHDLAKHLPPPLMKGESFESANWKVCDKELSVHEIRVAIKDALP